MNNLLILCWLVNVSYAFLVANNAGRIRHYLGCYHSFDGHVESVSRISVESCLYECKNYAEPKYTFAALKNGDTCYCGNSFGTSTQESNCQRKCENSPNEYCGGKYYSVYSLCLIGFHGKYCDEPCSGYRNSIPCMRNSGKCFMSKCSKDSHQTCDIARLFNDVNVAFNRPVGHIKTHTYDLNPAEYDVVGYYDLDLNNNYYSNSENYEFPWFYVDLEMRRNIKKVRITNRGDIHGGRLLGGHIYLSNSRPTVGKDYLCGTVTILHSIEIECASTSKYRYVIVTLSEFQFMTIFEIEAFIGDCSECKNDEKCESIYMSGNIFKRCTCKDGLEREDICCSCTDIDECETIVFDKISTECINTDGSFKILCKDGFERRNDVCEDIDECLDLVNHDPKLECTNSEGGFAISCPRGYNLVREAHRNICKGLLD